MVSLAHQETRAGAVEIVDPLPESGWWSRRSISSREGVWWRVTSKGSRADSQKEESVLRSFFSTFGPTVVLRSMPGGRRSTPGKRAPRACRRAGQASNQGLLRSYGGPVD